MTMNKRAPVAVNGNQTEWARRAREVTPVGGCRRRREMPIRVAILGCRFSLLFGGSGAGNRRNSGIGG